MIIKKSNRIRRVNSRDCIVYEYPFGEKNINIAEVEINGRYPEKGFAVNNIFKEIVFVKKGKGKITIDGRDFEIEPNDSILILPNKKYFWNGKMKLVIACSPAFNVENHRTIEA